MISQAESLLRQMLGPNSSFRTGQWETIEAVAGQRQRILAVQNADWGKGVAYLLAARLLRGGGPTVILSPALASLRRLIAQAERLGLRVASLGGVEAWSAAREALRQETCDVLLVSAERPHSPNYLTFLLSDIASGLGLLVVDEAHCISDWSHDFRPEYRRLLRIARTIPSGVPILAATSTASDRVINDIRAQLGGDFHLLRGPLELASLRLQSIRLQNDGEKLAWLAENVCALPGSGLIYCLAPAHTSRVAAWLRHEGWPVEAYPANLSSEERLVLEGKLANKSLKALAVTPAVGKGFEAIDLSFVVHYQMPGSIVAYYQQVGQTAGEAYGILLHGHEDEKALDYSSRAAFPSSEAALSVLKALERAERMGLYGILQQVNLSRSTVEQALRLMETEGAVGRDGGQYFHTADPWQPDAERAERIAGQRRLEWQQMQQYAAHDGCLMEHLTRALDDPAPARCGRCSGCEGSLRPREVSPARLRKAVEFIKRDYQVIEPRSKWPVDATPNHQGRISLDFHNREGRALSIYGDAGWGQEVARCKHVIRRFSEGLLQASVDLIQRDWNPQPAPAWVTAVPSLRRPKLVYDFARRLAKALGLPFLPVLVRVADAPEQRLLFNSAQQSRNVRSSLAVNQPCLSGPVLLVDDVVDSRWTMTVAGWLLRRDGSGPVYPFALAAMAGEES